MELVPPRIVAPPDRRSEISLEERPSATDVCFFGAVARIH